MRIIRCTFLSCREPKIILSHSTSRPPDDVLWRVSTACAILANVSRTRNTDSLISYTQDRRLRCRSSRTSYRASISQSCCRLDFLKTLDAPADRDRRGSDLYSANNEDKSLGWHSVRAIAGLSHYSCLDCACRLRIKLSMPAYEVEA